MNRVILAMILVLASAMPTKAAPSANECVRRFNACASVCAALESEANNGCLGRCLVDNGCDIDGDRATASDAALPEAALPRGTLPNDRLPASKMPDSRM